MVGSPPADGSSPSPAPRCPAECPRAHRSASTLRRTEARPFTAKQIELAETFADPEFQSESKRLGLGADAPQSGEQIAGVIRRVYGTTPHVLDRLRKLDKVPP